MNRGARGHLLGTRQGDWTEALSREALSKASQVRQEQVPPVASPRACPQGLTSHKKV